MSLKISIELKSVLETIQNQGYEAYIVGGYVRDSLLGIENYDIDITTSATPDVLKQLFKDYELEEQFLSFGSVKFNFNKYHIEITTFRKEYDYIKHRKPSKIEFAKTLKDDLIRRDFAINALCFDGEKIIDLFGGIRDLEHKIIKTIGNPAIRFEEDALRILRALRFSSKLSFDLDLETKQAIIDNCKYLDGIAFETKYRELKGILDGRNYLAIIKEYKDVLKGIFKLDDLKVTLFDNDMAYEIKEALFFYYSNVNINNKYLLNKYIIYMNDKVDLKYKLNEFGKDNIYNDLYFKSNVLNENKEIFKLLNDVIDSNECYNLKMLDINGEDLLKNNVENNKIGKRLNMLLKAVIENKCDNKKDELLKYLKNNILD